MRRLVFVLALGLASSGCMTRMSFVPSGIPFVQRANVRPSEVRLYRSSDALPSFVEVGYLEYDQVVTTGAPSDFVLVQRLLAETAASHGCNAIVIHDGCARTMRGRRSTWRLPRVPATCVWVYD
jgi:hypothetical protein